MIAHMLACFAWGFIVASVIRPIRPLTYFVALAGAVCITILWPHKGDRET